VMIGAVIASRTIQTKKGDTMGFIQLEDVQGTYECVAFPRTWKQTQDLWQKDKIVLVRGTIDGKGRVPKILLDSATDKPQVTSAVPDKNKVPAPLGKNGFQTLPANGRPAVTNGGQKPNAVKEQGASYQAAPAKPVSQPAAAHAQPLKANSQQPHRGASQPAVNNQQPANGEQPATRAAIEDHFEIPDEAFFDEDPFAGEVFILDMDDPAASVAPVEDFGVPKHDNPLAESTADYRGRTAGPIADVVKREFTASVPSGQAAGPPAAYQPAQPEPAQEEREWQRPRP